MNQLTRYKRVLTVVNVLIVSTLIFWYHLGFFDSISLPFFIVIVLGLFILAFYNPLFSFVVFVGVIPLEIINLSPEGFDIMLRPYQLVAVITFIAFILRSIIEKARFTASADKLITSLRRNLDIFDVSVIALVILSIVSMFLIGGEVVIKQTIVFLSFIFIFFITRIFVRNKDDVIALFPIIISSGAVVSVYAILQNILYKIGVHHMEVMPGRPNATFSEADWLGMYLVFVIAVSLAYLYYSTYHKHLWKFFNYALFATTSTLFVALIITVARSAWLGVIGVFIVYLLILFFSKRYNKLFVKHLCWITAVSVLSVIIVVAFNLTSFELNNRVTSTSSGLQEITVSCVSGEQAYRDVPPVINNIDELKQFNCRHINLEEINSEETIGNTVIKIHRKDPNVVVRANTYSQTIEYIKQRPGTGYGWGGSSKLLGEDENGTPLNASNIFLEIALSVGIIGMSIFLVIFLSAITFSAKVLRISNNMKEKSIAIFAILGTVAIIIPNLFNAGLLLGFIWVFFGMMCITLLSK